VKEDTPRGALKTQFPIRRTAVPLMCLMLLAGWAASQISAGGRPYSFDHPLSGDVDTVVMPPVDVAALLAEDVIEREMGLPFRFDTWCQALSRNCVIRRRLWSSGSPAFFSGSGPAIMPGMRQMAGSRFDTWCQALSRNCVIRRRLWSSGSPAFF